MMISDDDPAAFVQRGSVPRCPHIVVRDVLGAEGVADLLDHVERNRTAFRPGATWNRGAHQGGVDHNRRDCLVMSDLGMCTDRVVSGLRRVVPAAIAALHIDEPAIGALELEISSYGDGGHFHTHIDTLENPARVRILSCVYYFTATPRQFAGGDLRLYGFPGSSGPDQATWVDVQPETDTLVAFPSWMRHEVRPVRTSSSRWCDRRFAINCWVHRAAP